MAAYPLGVPPSGWAGGLAFVLATLASLTPGAAHAGNDDELFVGNQAAMVGGSVSAIVHDSSSTWYNPAGLGAIERDQVDVSATVYTLRLYSAPKFISTTSGESDDGSVTEFVVAPSQIAYVRRLNEGMSLGLGYFMPRSENYVLREALETQGLLDGSAWQIAGAVTEAQHIGAAALGYALTPHVRIGASLIGSYRANTQSASLFGQAREGGAQVAAKSITFIGTASRITMQVGLGLQVDLSDALALGISVRGPELQLHQSSDTSANTVIASLEDPIQPLLVSVQSRFQEGQGIEVFRSGRAGLALAYRFARGWVSAEIDLQPRLKRGENDRVTLWNARTGLYYTVAPTVALGVGLFTDRFADRQRWVLVSGGGDYYGGTLGLELSNEHLLAPGERVKSLVFTSVFAIRYAYSAGDIGRIEADPKLIRDVESDEGPFIAKRGDLNVHELGLYVGSGLRF